jgi:hypothetical protein
MAKIERRRNPSIPSPSCLRFDDRMDRNKLRKRGFPGGMDASLIPLHQPTLARDSLANVGWCSGITHADIENVTKCERAIRHSSVILSLL